MTHLTGFIFSFSIVALSLQSCDTSGEKDVRDYYFPFKELTGGLVYEYQPSGQDSLGEVYWYYRSFLQDDGIFLAGTYYEADLIPLQLVREEMVSNGILLADLFLYYPDTTGRQQRITADIEAGNVFPFTVSDSSGILLYKVHIELPGQEGSTTTLIKNRRYVGDTTFVYQGRKYDAVRFEVKELIEDFSPTEGSVEPQYRGEEIYARGLGLVYYEKQLGPDKLAYRLSDRYPMEQLEKAAAERMAPEAGPK